VVDVFPLNDRQKTLTLRISFNGEDKTLTGAWIKAMTDRIVVTLKKAGFPLKA
jgi:phenylalanyl-tRNA synthetase beta chain